MNKMVQKDPADRYAGASELIEDLELVASGRSPSSAPSVGPLITNKPRRRRKLAAAVARVKARGKEQEEKRKREEKEKKEEQKSEQKTKDDYSAAAPVPKGRRPRRFVKAAVLLAVLGLGVLIFYILYCLR